MRSIVTQKFLMCPPTNFAVEYAINPWMRGNAGQVDRDLADAQWNHLVQIIDDCGGEVVQVQPEEGFPDQVFTANVA